VFSRLCADDYNLYGRICCVLDFGPKPVPKSRMKISPRVLRKLNQARQMAIVDNEKAYKGSPLNQLEGAVVVFIDGKRHFAATKGKAHAGIRHEIPDKADVEYRSTDFIKIDVGGDYSLQLEHPSELESS